ncbi:MAG: PAS domain-containing protein [Chloroflexales bacterium]|nr:PAS domain-containing protein [Chloroflexales bacterium]
MDTPPLSEIELLAEMARLRTRNAELEAALTAQAASSEQWLHGVLETMQESVLLIGADWRYRYLNAAAERQSRRPREELLGRTVMECWPGIEDTEFFQLEQQVMHERVPARIDGPFTFPDGQERWFEWKIEPAPEGLLILTIDITERKRAEQLAQDQERRLRTVTNTIPALIWSGRPDGFIDYLNDGWLAFTGLTEDQALGTGWMQALHPEDRAATEVRWAEATRTGTFFEVEQRLRGADGTYHWFLTRAQPVREPTGTVSAWHGVNVDITERKAVKAALQRSQGDLLKFASQVPGMLYQFELRPDGSACLPFCTDAIRDLFGATPEQVREDATPLFDLVHPEDRDGFTDAIAQSTTHLTPFQCEYRVVRPDQPVRWIWSRSTPERLATGGVRWHGYSMDVTSQKQAAAALQAAHDALEQRVRERTADLQATQVRLQLAVQAGKVGLWDWDLRTNQVYFSPEYQRMLGYADEPSANEFAEWERRVHPDDLGPALENVRAFIRQPDGDYWNEFRMRHCDGTYRWVLSQASLFSDAQGQPVRMLGSHIDVTASKQAEAALAAHAETLSRMNAELTRALRLKDEFMAMMSHELRTPLNAVLGITDGLLEEGYGPLSPRQRQALEYVVTGGQHLLGILSDILDLTRIEAGVVQLDTAPVKVERLCRTALQIVAERVRKKEIRLLPTVAFGLVGLRADERRLTQILVNLLDNAVKFTPAQGTVGLEVEGNVAREQITFTVWDTGIGIATEDMGRLFQPFTQVDGRLARSYDGIGLGLTLVQRLTELHGGSVQVASIPGMGSRFTITLPWAEDDNFPSSEPGAARPAVQPTWEQPPHVLVAEDHEPTLELYAEQLARAGCTITTARTGIEALAQIQAQRPDVVVLDIQLPELDGLSVIRQVREDAVLAATPIIAVTALAMPGDRERGLSTGASAYLTKPVGVRTLMATIAELYL